MVVPALPGFGFSGKPTAPLGPRTTARLFDTLMREELGYPRYHAQGGDWGAGVTAWLALDHAASVKAIHLNYLLVQPDAEAEPKRKRPGARPPWTLKAASAPMRICRARSRSR